MDTSKITNPSVRAAFDALQAGDKAAWFAQFTADAELIDDGRPLDFKAFFEKAIGSEDSSALMRSPKTALRSSAPSKLSNGAASELTSGSI